MGASFLGESPIVYNIIIIKAQTLMYNNNVLNIIYYNIQWILSTMLSRTS